MNKNITKREKLIPKLGLGTWQVTGDECTNAVKYALEIGYTHIDTADVYNNHQDVAKGINQANVERDDFFLTTKLWRTKLKPELVEDEVDRFLKELDTDYIDLLLIHWPNEDQQMAETLHEMTNLIDKGKLKHTGISNFTIRQINKLKEDIREIESDNDHDHSIVIANHQFEIHPTLQPRDLIDFTLNQDITVTAYSPLGQTDDLELDLVQELAEKYDAEPAQIVLAWIRQQGLIAIPRSSSEKHIKENLESLDVELTESEIEEINGLGQGNRIVEPDFSPY